MSFATKPVHEPSDCGLTVRPLVRYVDSSQAVVDVHITVHACDANSPLTNASGYPIDIHIQMAGPDGYVFEHRAEFETHDGTGMIRFEMGQPKRWWPASMGDQPLYDLGIAILIGDDVAHRWHNTFGLTSVRPAHTQDDAQSAKGAPNETTNIPAFLVNGQECSIYSVVPVHPADERHVLPVGDHSLLVVRDHYGPDLLYHAADRAGTLLIQSIPESPDIDADTTVLPQIDRLAGHPSLAGWLVTQTETIGDRLANRIHELDPTRSVFRNLPGA